MFTAETRIRKYFFHETFWKRIKHVIQFKYINEKTVFLFEWAKYCYFTDLTVIAWHYLHTVK